MKALVMLFICLVGGCSCGRLDRFAVLWKRQHRFAGNIQPERRAASDRAKGAGISSLRRFELSEFRQRLGQSLADAAENLRRAEIVKLLVRDAFLQHLSLALGQSLLGNCFRPLRTGDDENGERRRGVRGSGGREGRRKDAWAVPRCSERRTSGGESRWWRGSCAQMLDVSIAIRAAAPRFTVGNFLAAVFSGAVSVVSVGAEDEDGTVFEGDFDWLSE